MAAESVTDHRRPSGCRRAAEQPGRRPQLPESLPDGAMGAAALRVRVSLSLRHRGWLLRKTRRTTDDVPLSVTSTGATCGRHWTGRTRPTRVHGAFAASTSAALTSNAWTLSAVRRAPARHLPPAMWRRPATVQSSWLPCDGGPSWSSAVRSRVTPGRDCTQPEGDEIGRRVRGCWPTRWSTSPARCWTRGVRTETTMTAEAASVPARVDHEREQPGLGTRHRREHQPHRLRGVGVVTECTSVPNSFRIGPTPRATPKPSA